MGRSDALLRPWPAILPEAGRIPESCIKKGRGVLISENLLVFRKSGCSAQSYDEYHNLLK